MTRWEVTFTVPGPVPSAANMREHWAAKHRRVAKQRTATTLALKVHGGAWLREWRVMRANEALRVRCALTRTGPRRLDDDNLRGALKAHRDAVAAEVGIDDGSARWTWEYAQAHGAPGVVVRLEVLQRETA
jgi:succinylarginine dihydrolase